MQMKFLRDFLWTTDITSSSLYDVELFKKGADDIIYGGRWYARGKFTVALAMQLLIEYDPLQVYS